MPDHYLVDTSVLARARQEAVGDRLEDLARFRSHVDLPARRPGGGLSPLRAHDVAAVVAERRALPTASTTPAVMDRALQVAGLLARAGKHRGAKPADLVIAAAAEASGLTVLHYDADYDRIAPG